MHSTRVWTIAANMPAYTLQLLASEVLGTQPGVTDGVWASVDGLGGNQPPRWMIELSKQLAARGIQHALY
ncbi:MAG: hypothetical protein DIU79_12040 [Actinobacteria bacterium]|nr:MAG: hypothetical protein DIU79_12040 [Actinomycetota bacterium]